MASTKKRKQQGKLSAKEKTNSKKHPSAGFSLSPGFRISSQDSTPHPPDRDSTKPENNKKIMLKKNNKTYRTEKASVEEESRSRDATRNFIFKITKSTMIIILYDILQRLL